MKKLLSLLLLFSNAAFALRAEAQTISAENMDDFHPEIAAGQVPTPEVQVIETNPESLAVVPFEEGATETDVKGQIQEIEIYPLGQKLRRKSSEPDNPVNNVLKAQGKIDDVMQAPTLKIGPKKQMPEHLLGASY